MLTTQQMVHGVFAGIRILKGSATSSELASLVQLCQSQGIDTYEGCVSIGKAWYSREGAKNKGVAIPEGAKSRKNANGTELFWVNNQGKGKTAEAKSAEPVESAETGDISARLDAMLSKGGLLDQAHQEVQNAKTRAQFDLNIHGLRNGKVGVFYNPTPGKTTEDHLIGEFGTREEAEQAWLAKYEELTAPAQKRLRDLNAEMEELRAREDDRDEKSSTKAEQKGKAAADAAKPNAAKSGQKRPSPAKSGKAAATAHVRSEPDAAKKPAIQDGESFLYSVHNKTQKATPAEIEAAVRGLSGDALRSVHANITERGAKSDGDRREQLLSRFGIKGSGKADSGSIRDALLSGEMTTNDLMDTPVSTLKEVADKLDINGDWTEGHSGAEMRAYIAAAVKAHQNPKKNSGLAKRKAK